jgi:hypothetical protein
MADKYQKRGKVIEVTKWKPDEDDLEEHEERVHIDILAYNWCKRRDILIHNRELLIFRS